MNTIMLLIKSFPIFKRNGLRFTVGLRQINWKYQIYFWEVQKHREVSMNLLSWVNNKRTWKWKSLNEIYLESCQEGVIADLYPFHPLPFYCYYTVTKRKHLEETVSFIHRISTEDYVPCQYLELTEEQIKLEEISSADESCFYFQEIDVRPSHLLGHQFIVLTSQSISIRNLSIPCRPLPFYTIASYSIHH